MSLEGGRQTPIVIGDSGAQIGYTMKHKHKIDIGKYIKHNLSHNIDISIEVVFVDLWIEDIIFHSVRHIGWDLHCL